MEDKCTLYPTKADLLLAYVESIRYLALAEALGIECIQGERVPRDLVLYSTVVHSLVWSPGLFVFLSSLPKGLPSAAILAPRLLV